MVGVHNYIIVNPKKTNPYTHGFRVYNNKIYARIVLDNSQTTLQIVQKIKKLYKKGFHNFFIDPTKKQNSKTLIALLNKITLDTLLQNAKIILHPTPQLSLKNVANTFSALVLYNAEEKKNIHKDIVQYKQYTQDIIDIERSDNRDEITSAQRVTRLQKEGLIPYITNEAMDIYGYGAKNAVKREILTLIDEGSYDRTILASHQCGALPLEYQGYIQKLYDIRKGLPDIEHMNQYAGVVIWLNRSYKFPEELVQWVKALREKHIYVAFANSFGFNIDAMFLEELGIDAVDGEAGGAKTIVTLDPIMNYEVQTKPLQGTLFLTPPKNSKALFSYKDSDGFLSTPIAITPWGGYALGDSFIVEINGENLWSVNPFAFFREALRLKPLPVPDTTTENGSRLFFTHVDGDGFINRVEFAPRELSGEVIYKEILKKYHLPHSVSFIGAEVMPNGLYPKLSKRCLSTIKKMYALDNVEPATHTFTHTFFWGKIKNGNLKPEYRLKPKGYKYSISYETKGMLDYINDNLLKKDKRKRARTVFWSGDCAPRKNVLSFLYKNNILNINGGYTTISNAEPWLALVSPLGIARGEFYQIYTAAENENVFTNDWLGPFWGFKKVVQTFKLTDKPKRLKPIDIYYHFYSGSKQASLNALRYVFNWVLKQPNIMPIFTSDYIPKVMDFYTVSMAKEGDKWLVDGMKNLKTVRLETPKEHIDYKNSPTVLGEKRINHRTYVAFDTDTSHIMQLEKKQEDANHLVVANGKISKVIKGNRRSRYIFESSVNLTIQYHLKKGCFLKTTPLLHAIKEKRDYILKFPSHRGIVDVRCR